VGLNRADMVYELLAEGSITRYEAIFHERDPEEVGPVRSARFGDRYILPMLRGATLRGRKVVVRRDDGRRKQ
jgi:hypothetical protein